MFMKQYNYKPRSNSQSSEGGVARTDNAARVDTQPAKADPSSTNAGGAVTGAVGGRRRSSDTQKYAGLNNYKRNSTDVGAAERKANWADQQPGGGILSGMWNNFTKGSK